jgi:endonuclease/exonuclease/phosphatase family metal-dependent hydrolase
MADVKKIEEVDRIYSDNSVSRNFKGNGKDKIVFLNAERGKSLDEIEAYFEYHPDLKDASIILLNEIDVGMARSGNRNNAKEFGERLSMNWFFGVEFLELTKGEPSERASGDENKESLHGNAILSKYPIKSMEILRLPMKYDWFFDFQKREGGRVALFATIEINGRDILFVSVHLENRTDEQGRCKQLRAVADLADKKYPDLPVIIAGDMNTFTYEDGDDEVISDLIRNDGDMGKFRRENPGEWETLFDFMEGRGYDFQNCNQKNKISCRDHIKGLDFLLEMNLDWFFTRGIKASEPSTVTTIFNSEDLPGFEGLKDSNGIEMTDHNILSIYME